MTVGVVFNGMHSAISFLTRVESAAYFSMTVRIISYIPAGSKEQRYEGYTMEDLIAGNPS